MCGSEGVFGGVCEVGSMVVRGGNVQVVWILGKSGSLRIAGVLAASVVWV